MPGTILSDDAEQMYADRLKQHAQSVWDTIASAPQQVAQAVQPAFQAASAASQSIQPIVPSVPQGPDPSAVQAAQQSLLQHAQDTWSNVSSAVNPQATTAQTPQEAPQAAPAPAQPVDQSAVNDASQRLLQHANDTWQSIGSGLSQTTAPVQQAAQAATQGLTQATSPAATNPTVTPDQNAPPPDRSMSYQDYAKAAAQRAGIDPNVFIAQIQQESGFNPAARSPAGAIGIAQFMPDTAKGVGVDPTDPYAALDAAAREDAKRLSQYGGDWGKTLASYNAGAGAVEQYGGIPPYKETQSYVSTIMGNAQKAADAAGTTISGAVQAGQQAVGGAIDTAKQAASNVLPAVSQFGDKQLSSAEAYAACGPAAAVRFAQMYGRNPTLREATDLAKGVGWTQDTGMAGLQSESKLFDQMGIPHRVVGADWNALQREAQSGNPVTISTPGHYFTADSYDPKTGAFHVGSSGTDLKSGSEWMTPQQMESVMGPLQGGLAADNPNTPGASPLSQKPTGSPSGPIDSTVQAAQQGWQAVGGGLQSIDNAVQSAAQQAGTAIGGAAQQAGTAVSGAVQGAQQAVGGLVDTARTAAQQAADTAGQGLPDVTGTLTPDAVPGGAQSPLGKIAQGQKVTPAEQLEAAGQTALGYEQSRSQAAAGIDPLRNLPGGNVIGPTVEQLTDPASWVGVGSVKSAIGVAASVAASVGAQQVAQNLIPDDDPNKGVKVALVSLLGAFTGGPVGERTIAPLVDRANTLVSSLGTEGASQLVQRAADVAGERVAPAVRQFVSEELGAVGHPEDVAAERARQAGFTAPAAPEVPTTRMYHGTGSEFERPTGERFDPNGLFGPGYYLTDRPEVAGGAVSRGRFGVNPETGSTSTYNRATGKFETYMTDVGKLLEPGYAQQRTQLNEPALQDLLGRVADDMHDSRGYFGAGAQEEVRKLIGNEGYRATYTPQQKFETLISALTNDVPNPQKYLTELAPDIMGQGGNVRALDVPQNLNLFDADAPVPEGTLEAINRVLTPEQRSAFEDSLHTAQVFASSGRSLNGQAVSLSGTDVYEALGDALRQAPPDETGTVAWAAGEGAKSAANRVLADAGFDGITYAGGKRIPMTDATGAPIEHQATVVFPDSLDKIRNAISGTQGGQANVGYAARLGGAAAGGVAGYQTTPDDASPQERALRTAGGAVAGYAGVAAASKVVSALSDILKPDLAAPQLEQAIKTVNETDATAPQIAAALDQVRKMPGTAELAPVRQQVPQSSTDLLQAMLDAAKAKGADPDKLSALEQQITAMDPTAATRRALTDTGGVRGALGSFLTGDQSELGAVSPRLATTLGGAAAGGLAGNATTPEDASTPERAMRILAGAGIGAGVGSAAAGLATSRGILPQQVLENLRAAGVQVDRGVPIPPPSSSERLDWLTNQGRFAPPEPPTPRGPIARGVDATKQALLSNPATHTAYVIGNVLELLRSPAALAMGGRGDDAIAGITSVGRGIPAAADAARAALQGQSLPTLAHVGAPTGGPVYRVLGAVHAFSRTLGEYQGMAQEASRLLREADIAPNDPEAAAYLAAHANNIYDAGLRTGAGAVFMRPNSEAQGGNFLENMFRRYNSAKEGFLASPDLKQQALGGLMDFAIPFSGIPTQLLKVAANRLPVASQATGSIRAIKALQAGDMAGAQRAIGETGLESTIQLMIAKQIADGNITGADDPDHPDSIRLNGNWVDMKDAGGWTLPMRIMASWADGYAKGGQNIPAGTPGASPLEQTYNTYGPRFSAALTASMKPFAQAVPGENMMRLLADAGSGQGDVGRTALGLGQNITSRFTPGIARFAENLTDPVARDIDKKGVDSLWKGPASNIPGLAEMLPAKIDPTTGQPVPKASSGLGIFLGAKNDVASPLTIEARRLSDAGFSVTAPKTYPTEVTVAGSKVSLSPDEQRQVAEQTGATMDRLATQRLQSPEYQNATDTRKALILKAMITAADNTRIAAVQKVIGPQQWRSRIAAGRNVAGQLVNQAQPPTADDFAGFNPLSGETIGAQRAMAGVR